MRKMMTAKPQRLKQFAGVISLLPLVFCLSCSRQAPAPIAAPAKPQTDKEVEKGPVVESYESKTEAIAAEKFKLFERKIKNAEFAQAEILQKELRSIFEKDSDFSAFWQDAMPDSKKVRLTLMTMCSHCKSGDCSQCGGAGMCNICNGTAVCDLCKGEKKKYSCPNCACKNCQGSGRCRACKGLKTIPCDACDGMGAVDKQSEMPCRKCGGTGYTPGLRGPNGTTKIRCLTCGGSGTIARRVPEPCAKCQGECQITCPDCQGSAKCPDCQGKGRMPTCAACSGTGIIIQKCVKCAGIGKCPACEGLGKCQICNGSGKCLRCTRGGVKLFDFAIRSDWVNTEPSYILFDVDANKIVGTDTGISTKTVHHAGHKMCFNLLSQQIIWISTRPSFDCVKQIMR